MTTHAKETTPQDEAPHGAPQAGGFSGVAAPPGEGARAREAVTELPLLQAIRDEVRRRRDFYAAASGTPRSVSWARAKATVLDDVLVWLYHPNRTAAPAPSSPRAEAPEAEPTLDALARLERLADNWADERSEALQAEVRRDAGVVRAALRRAAPGAAPEQRDVSVALGKMDEVLRNTTDRVTPVMFLREQLEAVVAFLRATPAPTGERAGGEAEAEALRRAAGIVRRSAARFPRSGHEQSENALADHLDDLASHRAPVAAPRGTEGRHDA